MLRFLIFNVFTVFSLCSAHAGTVISFQDGNLNGYSGTTDTELSQQFPLRNSGDDTTITVNAQGVRDGEGLLRFGGLFGSGFGQIPDNANIESATLRLHNRFVFGSPLLNLHNMLVPWDEDTVTFNSFGSGVQPNGIEATVDPVVSLSPARTSQFHEIDVTASLRDWQIGTPNHGWVMIIPANSSGSYEFTSSDSNQVASWRPLLSVEISAVPEPSLFPILLGAGALLRVSTRRRRIHRLT